MRKKSQVKNPDTIQSRGAADMEKMAPGEAKEPEVKENRKAKEERTAAKVNAAEASIAAKLLTEEHEEGEIPEIQVSMPKTTSRGIFILVSVAVVALIFYVFVNWESLKAIIGGFTSAASPFIVAFFIAYLLHPLVKWVDYFFQKFLFRQRLKKLSKVIAVLLSYIFVIGLITLISIFIVPQVGNSLSELAGKTELAYNKTYDKIMEVMNDLEEKYPDLHFENYADTLKNAIPNLISYGTDMLSSLFPAIFSFSFGLVKGILNFLISIMVSFYMIFDQKHLLKNMKRLVYAVFSKKTADEVWKTGKECNDIFGGFIIGKMIDSLIIGILCFIGMKLLQFPYPLLFSVIVGVTNMIPYFGPIIGAIPGVVVYLLMDPLLSLFFAIFIFILQQFDGIYLGPTILGEKTGIRPLWVIFGITVGGAYGGAIGMFLGVPVVAVISYLLDKWVKVRLKRNKVKEESL